MYCLKFAIFMGGRVLNVENKSFVDINSVDIEIITAWWVAVSHLKPNLLMVWDVKLTLTMQCGYLYIKKTNV